MNVSILEWTYEELVEMLLSGMPERVRKRGKEILRIQGPKFQKLLKTSQMQFLKLQLQTGFKPLVRHPRTQIPMTPHNMIPREYSRFFHVNVVAAANTVAASVLRLNHHDTAILTLAGFFHDLGHGLFGHTSEIMLVSLDPTHDLHEKRTVQLLQGQEIGQILDSLGVTWQEVARVVDERGNLGAVQRLMDSAAWTAHDVSVPEFFGAESETASIDYLQRVLSSLLGVEKGMLCFSNVGGVQEVANRRAFLFGHWFKSHIAMQSQWGFNRAMEVMFKLQWLKPADMYSDRWHELDLVEYLRQLANDEGGTLGTWLFDLLSIASDLGLPQDRWKVVEFRRKISAGDLHKVTDEANSQFVVTTAEDDDSKLVKRFKIEIDGGNGFPVTIAPDSGIVDSAMNRRRCFAMIPNFMSPESA